jgi:hypothetical protein
VELTTMVVAKAPDALARAIAATSPTGRHTR